MRDLVEWIEENILPLLIGIIVGMCLVWSTMS